MLSALEHIFNVLKLVELVYMTFFVETDTF